MKKKNEKTYVDENENLHDLCPNTMKEMSEYNESDGVIQRNTQQDLVRH